MSPILKHLDLLSREGLRVIPLRANTKIPLYKGWQKDWQYDRTRRLLEVFPDSNIGVLLGDIVDVEGDSKEANDEILEMIGDYPHPTYTSSRSIHHLFQTCDPKLRILKVGQIEFRGHGHQSVLPPSVRDGIQYKWLRNFKFPVPEMPQALVDFYLKHKPKPTQKNNCRRIWCTSCDMRYTMHKTRYSLEKEVFDKLGLNWQCRKCRELDLRPLCRLVRQGA